MTIIKSAEYFEGYGNGLAFPIDKINEVLRSLEIVGEIHSNLYVTLTNLSNMFEKEQELREEDTNSMVSLEAEDAAAIDEPTKP